MSAGFSVPHQLHVLLLADFGASIGMGFHRLQNQLSSQPVDITNRAAVQGHQHEGRRCYMISPDIEQKQ